MDNVIRLGTRGSKLARWQTNHVQSLLEQAQPALNTEIEVFSTKGDEVIDKPLPAIGGKGLFTAELEAALHGGRIDIAVHSLKDLPTESPDGLAVGALPERANPFDALVSRNGHTLETLPQGAVIGTSSRRRAAQLLHHRPDFIMRDIRGNIDTRINKALDPDGDYDAILLACAGLERLEQTHVISETLPPEIMLPAPGQGVLGIQTRAETEMIDLLQPLHHIDSAAAVTAERAFLAALGGGCSLPIAAYGKVESNILRVRGRVTAPSGSKQIEVELSGTPNAAEQIGTELAQMALKDGARSILEALT